jgi:prophage DNA circulation protein
MATARDWTKTLFAASYKGVAFRVERDTEGGSRRIVEHEFPNRDVPFLEDLGEGVRHYEVTAYVASNEADSEAAAVMSICAQRGPGVLVLPMNGPVVVRCLDFRRNFDKDKMGYSAIELKFTREGFSGALATVSSLANLIYVQTEAAVDAIAAIFVRNTEVRNVPDYVAQAVTDGAQTALSTFEAVRTSRAIDVTVSATQRDVIAATFDDVPAIVASEDTEQLAELASTIVTIATDLAAGMEASVAVAAFEEIITSVAASVDATVGSQWQTSVARNRNASNTLLRLAAFAAYCEAIERLSIFDRQTGITLRANVAEYFDEQLQAMPADDYEIYVPVTRMRDAVIDYLSRAITTLVPSVQVEASASMPSLYWAWRLYADPNRTDELVSRNRVVHPSFMPTSFDALAE